MTTESLLTSRSERAACEFLPSPETDRRYWRCRLVKLIPGMTRRWETAVALFVGLGMAATVGWAVFETYWG
jgi:hypothetical protein